MTDFWDLIWQKSTPLLSGGAILYLFFIFFSSGIQYIHCLSAASSNQDPYYTEFIVKLRKRTRKSCIWAIEKPSVIMLTAHILKNTESVTKRTKQNKKQTKVYVHPWKKQQTQRGDGKKDDILCANSCASIVLGVFWSSHCHQSVISFHLSH